MKYFVGFFAIAVGVFMIIKTEWIIKSFGTSDWAEQHMSTSGGSRMLYKLIGIAFIVISLMGITGLLGPIILKTFGKLFGL